MTAFGITSKNITVFSIERDGHKPSWQDRLIVIDRVVLKVAVSALLKRFSLESFTAQSE